MIIVLKNMTKRGWGLHDARHLNYDSARDMAAIIITLAQTYIEIVVGVLGEAREIEVVVGI
jgi:hypothetical protein